MISAFGFLSSQVLPHHGDCWKHEIFRHRGELKLNAACNKGSGLFVGDIKGKKKIGRKGPKNYSENFKSDVNRNYNSEKFRKILIFFTRI